MKFTWFPTFADHAASMCNSLMGNHSDVVGTGSCFGNRKLTISSKWSINFHWLSLKGSETGNQRIHCSGLSTSVDFLKKQSCFVIIEGSHRSPPKLSWNSPNLWKRHWKRRHAQTRWNSWALWKRQHGLHRALLEHCCQFGWRIGTTLIVRLGWTATLKNQLCVAHVTVHKTSEILHELSKGTVSVSIINAHVHVQLIYRLNRNPISSPL